jgi:alginate O-acetyltransferase complex protein AlgI
MHIQTIALLAAAAVTIRLLSVYPVRFWLISAVSAAAIYLLQPEIPIRYMSFWLPSLTIFVVVINWILTTPREERRWKANLPMLLFLAAAILLAAASRYLYLETPLLASRPPQAWQVALVLAAAGALIALLMRFAPTSLALSYTSIALLIILFVVLKVPAFAHEASRFLRLTMGQTPDLASSFDIRWLGFSYLAFRLIHTLRDRAKGKLPGVSLQEYFNYVVFFPTITAGPIDRLDRFVKDLKAPLARGTLWADLMPGGRRVLMGVFKKFVIADTLALVAINAGNIDEVRSTGWLWLLLYAYAFQIFFDFSGYTDIAIGLGRILGFSVPENFHAPYLKPSLSQFWNNWHITLTQWIRVYYFNPLTRWLRAGKLRLPMVLVLLIGQVTTMLLIGLWHGVTLNFLIWGLWHGVGSFLENRWMEFSRPLLARYQENRPAQFGLNAVSVFLTFHYVSVGWLWFALPETDQAARALLHLFGIY